MERWLLERLNALFDTLLGLAVFALIALLPVSIAVKVMALLALILGLYALISFKRWSARLDVRTHAGKLLRRVSIAVRLSLTVYPSVPAPEREMFVLNEATKSSLPPPSLVFSEIPDTSVESGKVPLMSVPDKDAVLTFPFEPDPEVKKVLDGMKWNEFMSAEFGHPLARPRD